MHRVIKSILAGTRYTLPELPTPGEAQFKLAKRLASKAAQPGQQPRKAPSTASTRETLAWEAAGLHCSANERRADEASRDVEAWLKCKYMREHLGEEYSGVVSAVTSFGVFVTLDALYVEGLVHITELGGEYFRFDEARQELRGERTGIRYGIGARVQVQVSRVDLDGRRIDFRLVRDELAALQSGEPRSREPAKRRAKAAPQEGNRARDEKPGGKKAAQPAKAGRGARAGARGGAKAGRTRG